MKRPKSARAEAEGLLFSLFDDLVSTAGDTGIFAFADHIGMPLSTKDEGRSWWPCFLAHYTSGKMVDVDRAFGDLATFPPIARRIAELKAERAVKPRKATQNG